MVSRSKPRHKYFNRSRTSKHNTDHVGRLNSVQVFYEGPDSSSSHQNWVEYAPPSIPLAKKKKHEGAAVQVFKSRTKRYGQGAFDVEKIIVQSPYLLDVLKDVVEPYDIISKETGFIESKTPHHGLFFALDHIAEMSSKAEDAMTRSHCEILCLEIESAFADTLDELELLDSENKITYDLLWVLFPREGVIATQLYSSPPVAFKVKWVSHGISRLRITAENVQFDGFLYGTYLTEYCVEWFEGAVDVSAIPDLPFIDLAEDQNLRMRLLERGRRTLEMQTIRYMTYNPDVKENSNVLSQAQERQSVIIDPHLQRLRKGRLVVTPLPGYNIERAEDVVSLNKFCIPSGETSRDGRANVSHLVMNATAQDTFKETRYRQCNLIIALIDQQKLTKLVETSRRPTMVEIEQNKRIVLHTEDNLLVMNPYVAGYSLSGRVWDWFFVEDLDDVEADRTIFDKFVFDDNKKDIVKTLVEGHNYSTTLYDDLIPGKGECLLVLLSGPPGTGKTLMAECLAEHLGRPLLRADSDYLQGLESLIDGYDATIGQFLKDATEWGALVLFDEPDFLFQNQQYEVDRTELLTFLRHAEYFKGIIFLTTNLSRTIDPAVISRAQIHLNFPALDRHLRTRVWETFIERLPQDVNTLSLSDIAELSSWKINGREIKNALNMTVSWCRQKKKKLTLDAIEGLLVAIYPAAEKDEAFANGESTAIGQGSIERELALLDI